MKTLLTADIGGTKSDLAIFELVNGEDRLLFKKRYENAAFEGVEEITAAFLSEYSSNPSAACFAVAGIVKEEKVQLTNLPWSVNCKSLKQRFGLQHVYLINDLTAVASALSGLEEQDLLVIQKGSSKRGRVRAVIAPGTGLGQGFAIDFGGTEFVSGSEGGHTDFGPVNEEQIALLEWMRIRSSPVSFEMIISGPGIMNIYDFYRDLLVIDEADWVREKMKRVVNRTPIIIEAAMEKEPCPLCVKVVELFLSILGSEAGNLALKLYATGGLYLGGGILPRLKDAFGFSAFLRAFHNKGPMSELMKDFPVYLISRTDAALFGAKKHACQQIGVDSGYAAER